jgi:hypothetical protein
VELVCHDFVSHEDLVLEELDIPVVVVDDFVGLVLQRAAVDELLGFMNN